jgi:hypothetical protein
VSYERALAAIQAAQQPGGVGTPGVATMTTSQFAQAMQAGAAGQSPLNLLAGHGALDAATPQRRVEAIQRNIEFTQKLLQDTETRALGCRVAVGTELASAAFGLFLFMFGVRNADPTRGLLRSFATTRPQLARLGSLYCIAGFLGMSMTVTFLPMEYEAVKNTDFAVSQLQRTQRTLIQERDQLITAIQKSEGKSDEKK